MYLILFYAFVTLCAIFMTYLNSKFFDEETSKITYFKIILLCNAIVFVSVKIFNFLFKNGITAPNETYNNLIGTTKYLSDIGENMLIDKF